MTSEDKDDRPPSYVIFGAQQKRLREVRGLSTQELSDKIPYSVDLVRKIERGERRAQPDYIEAVDTALQAHGVLVVVGEHLSNQYLFPEWFEEYVQAEASALRIDIYDTHVVNGLLQTEAYAHAVLSAHHPTLDDEEVEARVAARLERQALLPRKPTCMLSFVIEEWVLRRPIGGKSALKGQLNKLIECARMRNVTIQVLPTACETHAGFDGPLTLLETAEGKRLGYVEGQAGSDWIAAPDKVRSLEGRYGIIRGQALNAEDSVKLIEELAGNL
ncbi:helix-turn-helix domain-containing protein [Streptomyces coffeae]|uniref:Helix-turn-helix domain-containing protein n=1 Tax=Streptomyces coffeae TaxID=621382 RepID=A0ABS1NHC5_9ACTN|nr:helix-turn-helix transcriptional regulator [Streptomyces coffeae]MBL1099499.1 helix-turn-helix domain-containing protein [Streptomyces coffeae]